MAEPVDTVLKAADDLELLLSPAEAAGWQIIDSLPEDTKAKLIALIDNDQV